MEFLILLSSSETPELRLLAVKSLGSIVQSCFEELITKYSNENNDTNWKINDEE